MAQKKESKKKATTQVVEEEVNINPEDIVLNEEDDTEMPEPEMKTYEKRLECSDLFMSLFMECVGSLPYSSILTNGSGSQIKLIDLVKFVEAKHKNILLDELNQVISFIANLEFSKSRKLMETVENPETQRKLWSYIS